VIATLKRKAKNLGYKLITIKEHEQIIPATST